MLKPSLIAVFLSFAALSTYAAPTYFVVVPVPGRATSAEGINVSLTGASLPSGLVGQPYAGFNLKSLLSVSGDRTFDGYGVKWSLASGSLPAGLSMNADGAITGTPTENGTSSFQVKATYKTKTGAQTFEIFIASITVGLAAGSPPNAMVGTSYSYDLSPLLTVSGDQGYTGTGVTWSVVSSTLPAGLGLTTDGRIAGTPTAPGDGSITVRASYKNAKGEQTFQVTTLNIVVSLASATLAQVFAGDAYAYDFKSKLSVSGDAAYVPGSGVTWSLASGALPDGLSLNATTGVVSGTPTTGGTFNFTLKATYRAQNGQQSYQQVVSAITVNLASTPPPAATEQTAYSYDFTQRLTIAGDSGYVAGSNVAWSVVSGSLPAGLTLNASTGVVSGTPTVAGNSSFTLQAAYKSRTGQRTYQMVVGAITVSLGYQALPNGVVGTGYAGYDFRQLLTVSGDATYTAAGVTWSVASGSTPPGLTLFSNGILSGTPSSATTSTFTTRATYKGKYADQSFTVTVEPQTFTVTPAGNGSGRMPKNTVAQETWTLTNTGNSAGTGLYISNFGGASGLGLSLISNGCGSAGAPITLAKGASCSFVVQYAPTSASAIGGFAWNYDINWSTPTPGLSRRLVYVTVTN